MAAGVRIVAAADQAGTLVFAVQGALAAMAAGLDPAGILVPAFLTARGGGMIRDTPIGARPAAAVVAGGLACVALRLAAVAGHRQLPARPFRGQTAGGLSRANASCRR